MLHGPCCGVILVGDTAGIISLSPFVPDMRRRQRIFPSSGGGGVRATIEDTTTRLDVVVNLFLPMSSNKQCYVRTLRNEWGLTQEELASLLPKGDRSRVGRIERGKARPNAGEILAYGLIFGLPARKIFRGLSEDTDEAIMQRAYRLSQRLEKDKSRKGQRKRDLVERLRTRAIKSTHQNEA